MRGESILAALMERQHGAVVWSVRKGVGSFLTLDLGDVVVETSGGRPRKFGVVHIWLQYCDWTLLRGGSEVLSSDSIDEELESLVKPLIGTQLIGIAECSSAAGVEITLSMGYTIRARSSREYEDCDDLLVIYEAGWPPIGYVPSRGFYQEEPADG